MAHTYINLLGLYIITEIGKLNRNEQLDDYLQKNTVIVYLYRKNRRNSRNIQNMKFYSRIVQGRYDSDTEVKKLSVNNFIKIHLHIILINQFTDLSTMNSKWFKML